MKKIKIILIHGTFASMTNWDDCIEEKEAEHNIYKGDSPFVSQLRDGLAKRGVEATFRSCNWSGDNSHQARREAAEKLNRILKAQKAREDGRDGLYLIGHSHGGTVARLAVNQEPHDVHPSGIITFGSPFVRFEPRPVEFVTTALQWIWRMAVFILGFLYLALVIISSGGALALLIFGNLIWGLISGVDAWIGKKAAYLCEVRDGLCAEFDPEPPVNVPYLNYHARFDEAGLLLRFWSLPTWLANTVLSAVVRTGGIIVLLMMAVFTFEFIFIFGYFAETEGWLRFDVFQPAFTWFYGHPVPPQFVAELGSNSFGFGFVTLMLVLIVTCLIAPFCIYLPWLMRRGWISFGGEQPSWTFASRIRVDRLGGEEAEIRPVFLPQAWREGAMQHNYYHQDPKLTDEVAARLADWKIKPTKRLYLERRLFTVLELLVQAYLVYLALWFAIDLGAYS